MRKSQRRKRSQQVRNRNRAVVLEAVRDAVRVWRAVDKEPAGVER
jgi:hypothetical protein